MGWANLRLPYGLQSGILYIAEDFVDLFLDLLFEPSRLTPFDEDSPGVDGLLEIHDPLLLNFQIRALHFGEA
jgi:hypothetical protein